MKDKKKQPIALVRELPKDCMTCPFFDGMEMCCKLSCEENCYEDFYRDDNTGDINCPLKTIDQYLEEQGYDTSENK